MQPGEPVPNESTVDGAVLDDASKPSKKRRIVLVIVASVALLAVVSAVAVAVLGVRSEQVFSSNLEPTLNVGDRYITWDFGEVERHDIVIFERPQGSPAAADLSIQRVIALEGETVSLSEDGAVLIDGDVLDEPYLGPEVFTVAAPGEGPWTVPAGQMFVLGDNRNQSLDSRFYGPVPLENVVSNNVFVWRSGSE